MKTGLTIADVPHRGTSREPWARDLVVAFRDSGDEVWELTVEDVPGEDMDAYRPTLAIAAKRYGAGRTAKRGDSIFLIRGGV